MSDDPSTKSPSRSRRRIGGALLLLAAAVLAYVVLWIIWAGFDSEDSPEIWWYLGPLAALFGLLFVAFAMSAVSLLRAGPRERSAASGVQVSPGTGGSDARVAAGRTRPIGNALLVAAAFLIVLGFVIGWAAPEDDGSFDGLAHLFWLILCILASLPLIGLGIALRSLAPGWPRTVVIIASSIVLAVLALIAAIPLLATTSSG